LYSSPKATVESPLRGWGEALLRGFGREASDVGGLVVEVPNGDLGGTFTK